MHIWVIEEQKVNGEWIFYNWAKTRKVARVWIRGYRHNADVPFRIRKYVREEPGTLLVSLNG